jgi:hypothetical protein
VRSTTTLPVIGSKIVELLHRHVERDSLAQHVLVRLREIVIDLLVHQLGKFPRSGAMPDQPLRRDFVRRAVFLNHLLRDFARLFLHDAIT